MIYDLLVVSLENMEKGYPKNVSIGEAALYALLGFLVVFAGIALLIFIVWALGKLMKTIKGVPAMKPDTVKPEAKAEPSAQPAPVAAAEATEPDEETVAVIMAALMAYYQTNYPKCEFTVKRIKRI